MARAYPSWTVLPVLCVTMTACGGDDGFGPDAGTAGDGGADGATPDQATQPPGLSIRFDYRFDDAGWATPAHRLVLEAAAQEWSDRFGDDFPDIPSGTSLRARDPENPTAAAMVFDSTEVIDDLLVFVGCSNIDGAGNVTATSNHSAALSSVVDATLREQLRARYEGATFEPWTGWISFDCGESWFVDATPATDDDLPGGQPDLMSVAMHEIGHVLGFGTANAFLAKVDGAPAYTGAQAMAAHGGPVPMIAGGTHFVSGLSSDGREPLMDPSRAGGTRFRPTTLDRAALADLGYDLR